MAGFSAYVTPSGLAPVFHPSGLKTQEENWYVNKLYIIYSINAKPRRGEIIIAAQNNRMNPEGVT